MGCTHYLGLFIHVRSGSTVLTTKRFYNTIGKKVVVCICVGIVYAHICVCVCVCGCVFCVDVCMYVHVGRVM